MDGTLIQIINQWIDTQAALVRVQQENEQLKAQLAGSQQPKIEPVTSSNGKAPLDAKVTAEQNA